MRLKKLVGKNFLSYKNFDVDFTKYSKVLIIGINNKNLADSNGSGKTNLCEAIGFAVWGKSRAKTLDLNVKFEEDECIVYIEFEHDSKECSIERKRNKVTGTTSVDFYMDGVRSNGNSATETDEKIVSFLKINYKTYVNSVYLKQDSNFSLANPEKSNDGRNILEQVLSLEEYEKFEKKAKKKAKDVQENDINKLEYFIELNKDIETKLKENKEQIEILNSQKLSKENLINSKEKEYSKLKDIFEKIKEQILLKLNLEKELASIKKTIEEKVSEKEELKSQGKTLIEEKKPRVESLTRKILQKSTIDNEKLEFSNTLIQSKQNQLKINLLNSNLIDLNNKFDVLQEEYNKTDREEYSKLNDLKKEKENFQQKKQSFEQAKNGIVIGHSCPTCFSNMSENNIEFVKKHFLKECKDIKENIDNLGILLETLKNEKNSKQISLDLNKSEIEKLEKEIKEIQTLIINEKQKKDTNDLFEKRLLQIKEYEKDLEETNKNKNIENLKEKIMNLTKEIDSKKLDEQEISNKIKNILISEEAKNHEKELTDLKESIDSENMEFYKISASIDNFKIKLEENFEIKKKLEENKNSLSISYGILKTLEQLAHAFSSKGIRAKILQDAIFDLEKESNELLKRVANGRLSLEFVTKKDIIVSEGESSEKIVFEVNVSNGRKTLPFYLYSAGQQFRISFVLRIALSKLLLRRANSKLEFLIIDEVVSPLDQIGVENIMEIINELQSEFKTIMVITHRTDIKNLFDQVITVVGDDEEGSKIEL